MAESIENAGAMLFEASGTMIAGASGGLTSRTRGLSLFRAARRSRVHVEGGRASNRLPGELTLDGRLEVEGGSYGGGNLHHDVGSP